MTRISNKIAYKIKSPIVGSDYFPITNSVNAGVGMAVGATKSADFDGVRAFVIAGLNPELGGVLKFTEIEYNGVLTSPADVANALDPDYVVAQYEVLFFNINGNKYLLKLQDVTIGDTAPNIADSDFITVIGFENLGTGTNVLKGYNVATGNHEFYALKSTGLDVSIVTGDIVIEKKAGNNLGNGIPVYKGLNDTTKIDEFYNLKSSTLNVSKEIVDNVETGNVLIETPETASIPGLYVNNLYKPTYSDWVNGGGNLISNPSFLYKGEGTLSKPFTDSRNYTSTTAFTDIANTAIQNAKLAYVGTGTRLNPELIGQKIIVQDNNTFYLDAGDFNYSDLDIEFNGNVTMTSIDYLLDIDNASYFNSTNARVTIRTKVGYPLISTQSLGFKNSGNTANTNTFATKKTVNLTGDGEIVFTYNGANILTQYILNGEGNNNDGNIHFIVDCKLNARFQGVYNSKNKNRIDFYNIVSSSIFNSSVNINLRAFHQTGGQIRFFDKGSIDINGNLSGRNYGITFEPTGAGIGFCSMILVNTFINYNCNFTFVRLNNQVVNLTVRNCTGNGSNEVPGIPTVVEGVFENLGASIWTPEFNNNNFIFTGIDTSKVDLTQGNTVSVINTIGNNLIESLISFTSKQNAKSYPLPINSAYLLKRDVSAGSLIIGTEYKIKTAGTGTPLGTVGDYFIAANNGSSAIGGVATLIERCVMI